MITNIVIDIVESLCNLIQRALAMLLLMIVEWMDPKQFTPTPQFMKETLFTESLWKIILDWMSMLGKFIALAIFAYYVFLMAFLGFREVKDSLLRLIYRLILVAILNLSAVSILNFICDNLGAPAFATVVGGEALDTTYKGWFEESTGTNGTMATWAKSSLTDIGDDITAEGIMGLTAPEGITAAVSTYSTLAPILGIVFIFLRIVLLGFFLWNFFKLLLEMVRRYVVFGVMYMGFPAIVGTLASEPTAKIFHTYLKNFITQIAMLVLSIFWIYTTLYAFENISDNSIFASIALIAYMMIGVKLEQFLKDQGLSVTSSAGSILDAMLSTAAQMGMAAGLTKGAVSGAGKAIENIGGGVFGSSVLGRIGSGIQGNGFDASAGVRATVGSTGAQLKSAASEVMHSLSDGAMGSAAGHVKLTDSMAKDMMKLAGNGGFKNEQAFKEAFGKLGQADQSKFLNDYYKKDMLGIGADGKASNKEMMKALGATDAKQVSFTGMNKDGSISGTVKTKAGTQAFSMDTNASMKGNAVKAYDSFLNNDMYVSKGDFTPSKMEGLTPASEFVSENSIDALSNSALSSGLGHNVEAMNEFIASEGGIDNISINRDGDLVGDSGNSLISDGRGHDFIKDNELAVDGLNSYWKNHSSEYEDFCKKNNIDMSSMDVPTSSGGDRGDFITFRPKDSITADIDNIAGYVAVTGADNINAVNKGALVANDRLAFIPVTKSMNKKMNLFAIDDPEENNDDSKKSKKQKNKS